MTLMHRRSIRDEQITPGVIVVYTLRPDQRPRHPEKEWNGKVLRYDKVFHRAIVESLEEGYEGCEEDVWLGQIVRIPPKIPPVKPLSATKSKLTSNSPWAYTRDAYS